MHFVLATPLSLLKLEVGAVTFHWAHCTPAIAQASFGSLVKRRVKILIINCFYTTVGLVKTFILEGASLVRCSNALVTVTDDACINDGSYEGKSGNGQSEICLDTSLDALVGAPTESGKLINDIQKYHSLQKSIEDYQQTQTVPRISYPQLIHSYYNRDN